MTTLDICSVSWLLGLVIAASLFEIARIIYRLTFHPLAKFPGPKLAAVTNLYGLSYELFGINYVERILQLHDQYGQWARSASDPDMSG